MSRQGNQRALHRPEATFIYELQFAQTCAVFHNKISASLRQTFGRPRD